MVCAPVRSIIPSLKLGDYLSVQANTDISNETQCLNSLYADLRDSPDYGQPRLSPNIRIVIVTIIIILIMHSIKYKFK